MRILPKIFICFLAYAIIPSSMRAQNSEVLKNEFTLSEAIDFAIANNRSSKNSLLNIEAAKQQGATAGIAHLWKQSPNNSAVAYFTHCGGKLVKSHPDKWNEASKHGYNCILCGHDCHCEAAEMIIRF